MFSFIKNCLICNKEFSVNRPCKVNRAKFCSRKCQVQFMIKQSQMPKSLLKKKISAKKAINSGRFKKGMIPWNKDKKCLQISGAKNPNWKGGTKQSKGWIYLLQPDHPFADKSRYVRRSRLIMEKKLGRFLTPTEVVHHINGNRSDDRLENLILFSSQAEHLQHHFALKRLSGKTCQ